MLPKKTADIQLAVYGDANPYRRWERVKALFMAKYVRGGLNVQL